MENTSQLLSFYGWWQASVCLFAFAALIGIWWHIGRKQKDFGQVWLACSVLCWSFSGVAEICFAHIANTEAGLKGIQSFQLSGWRSIFSLFNSLFILLALPWFRYLPKQLSGIIKSPYWKIIIGLPFIFSLLPTVSKMVFGHTMSIISELDVYYAIFTIGFLGFVLWESFMKRRLISLAWLSLLFIIVTLIAQWLKMTGSDLNMTLFSAIFKTSLIMIFFALALSWVKELSENVIPDPGLLFLKLNKEKKDNGKFHHLVSIHGMPGKEERAFQLTPGNFELLSKFAKKKNEENEWLEIKPKNESRATKEYDIKDHNQIKRLLQAILDGLFGTGTWTKEQHELPLRSALFEMSEKRERKIRLRIPEQNIKIG